jgi:hypothetical protein
MARRPQNFGSQAAGFPKATPAEVAAAFDAVNRPLPASFLVHDFGDPVDLLPSEGTKARLLALRQRATDARALYLPLSDELRELRTEKQRADARLAQLRLRRGDGGSELGDDDRQVIDVRQTIERLQGEIARLSALEQHRSAVMHNIGTLLRSCEEWLRRGRPGGTVLVEAVPIMPGDVLKRGERLPDAVERLRHRLREIDADRRRIESATVPRNDAKMRLREQIERAERALDVSALVEHPDGEIRWPTITVQFPLVAMTENGQRIIGTAQGEMVDFRGLYCDLVLKLKLLSNDLDQKVDDEADDASALSQHDRSVKLAEVERDKLMTERQLASLIWASQARGEPTDHAPNASPLAVLGVELRVAQ